MKNTFNKNVLKAQLNKINRPRINNILNNQLGDTYV